MKNKKKAHVPYVKIPLKTDIETVKCWISKTTKICLPGCNVGSWGITSGLTSELCSGKSFY